MTLPKSVSITGATGFIGTNLSMYLEKEGWVVTKCKVRYGQPMPPITTDCIIHLAGKAHDLRNVSSDAAYLEANNLLTRQLFDTFLQSEATVFIYVSSVKAAADNVSGILTEEAEPAPLTIYGKSKLLAEQYLLSHRVEGKRIYILRPCMVHGPGNKGNLNLLYQLVAKGIPWPLGAFDNKRSFCSIGNFCFVVHQLIANTTISSGIYHLADDGSLSTNEVIQLIGTSLNRKHHIWQLPKGLINWLTRLGDRLHLPLNSERLHKLTENYEVSNAKIKAAIGEPLPLTAREGMILTFQSFTSNV